MLILLNKPFRVLSQFRDPDGRATLGDYVDVPGVYPAGRLDHDSEGPILLTDDGKLQARISQPKSRTPKTYLAQVEGLPTREMVHQVDGRMSELAAAQAQEQNGAYSRLSRVNRWRRPWRLCRSGWRDWMGS